MKREVKRLKQEKRLNQLNPKHHELKWYTDKNPFYYILNITYDEKYRTLTRLTINDKWIYLIGETHSGPTRMLNFNKWNTKTTVLMEAGNMFYRTNESINGLWLREPYFSYWYVKNNMSKYMTNLRGNEKFLREYVENSSPYKDCFNFIPYDYR